MAHRAQHLPSQLSSGQQQRLGVARAVVGEPLIPLAGEPTENLDSNSGEAVTDLLHEWHRGGATACLVTSRRHGVRTDTKRMLRSAAFHACSMHVAFSVWKSKEMSERILGREVPTLAPIRRRRGHVSCSQ